MNDQVKSRLGISRRGMLGGVAGAAMAMGMAPEVVRAAVGRSAVGRKVEDGLSGAGHYRFAIGGLTAWALSDGFMRVSPVQPVFAPEATPEELEAALKHAFHPTDRVEIQINILLVKMGKELVLIDTGAGSAGTNGRLPANMKAAGIDPAMVTAIVLSHAHGDHIAGALDADGAEVFPNARWIVGKAEHDFWNAPTQDMKDFAFGAEAGKGMAAAAQKVFKVIGKKMELVKGGDKVIDGLELIDTPGHTPGHMSVVISNGDERVAAMGDLAHDHVIMFANPAWTVGFDVDKAGAVASRRKMFDRLAADRTRVFGYHMPWPGLAHVRRMGEGFEWVQEPWAW